MPPIKPTFSIDKYYFLVEIVTNPGNLVYYSHYGRHNHYLSETQVTLAQATPLSTSTDGTALTDLSAVLYYKQPGLTDQSRCRYFCADQSESQLVGENI